MAESITVEQSAPKAIKYEQLIPQIKALVGEETHLVACLSNITAAIHETFGFLWTGFYTVEGNELVLGPFQGPVACMRITIGRGVSGAVLAQNQTLVVPDVDQFPGHIACSSLSRSEIVVPVRDKNGEIRAVFDADSAHLSTFDHEDKKYLEEICDWIGKQVF
ncbi:MAG: GAF domain-containing protein [Salibacteraceae bacterium]